MKRFYPLFLLILLAKVLFAENDIDSLLNIINISKGEQKIESLHVLAKSVFETTPKLSIAYANQAIAEAKEYNLKPEISSSYVFIAELLNKMSEPDSAINYYLLAEKYASENADLKELAKINHNLGDIYNSKSEYQKSEKCLNNALKYSKMTYDSLQTINTLINLGYLYEMQGRRDTAISCMEIALNQSELIGFKKGIAKTSLAMGNLYYGINNYEKALVYYNKTYKIAKEINNKVGIGISLTNIASVYSEIKQNNKAMKTMLKSIEYLKNTEAYSMLANSYSNLASFQVDSGLYEQAYDNLDKSLSLFRKYGNKEDIAISMFTHGYVFSKTGMYEKSNMYLDTALNIALEIDFSLMQQKVYAALAKNYSKLGLFEKALKNMRLSYSIKDSIESEKVQSQLMDFEVKYNTLQKEKEIEVLQKDQELSKALLNERRIERNAYLAALILVVILIILFVQKRKREKQMNLQKLQLSEQKQRITGIELEKSRLQKKELENKIDFQSKQLTTHALNMMQKNRLFKSLVKDLDALKRLPDVEKNQQINRLKRQVSQSLRGEKDWELFKMYFEKVNKNFYVKLKNNYHDLTSSELKLCALIKLNLNIKETAAILNLSPETIKSSRYRIRKKLNLNQEDDLAEFIQMI